jgi:hypothetical protein
MLQSRTSAGVAVLQRVSENPALHHIVEAKVWPWLEQESLQHRRRGVTPEMARWSALPEAASVAASAFREQIEPLAIVTSLTAEAASFFSRDLRV